MAVAREGFPPRLGPGFISEELRDS